MPFSCSSLAVDSLLLLLPLAVNCLRNVDDDDALFRYFFFHQLAVRFSTSFLGLEMHLFAISIQFAR